MNPLLGVQGLGQAGQDGWLENLRGEARREMIRRLTLERVREGGLVGGPRRAVIPAVCWKLLEAFTIGVAVALASAWVVHRTGLIKIQARKSRR